MFCFSNRSSLSGIVSEVSCRVQRKFACSKIRWNGTNRSANIWSRGKNTRLEYRWWNALARLKILAEQKKLKSFHQRIMLYLHQDGGENWPPPIGQSHIIIWTANNVKRTWFEKPVGSNPHFCFIYCLVSGRGPPIKFANCAGPR